MNGKKPDINLEDKEFLKLEKVPYSKIKKGYNNLFKFMIPVYITLLGMIASIPLWIWISWNIAWKIFITSLFLFLIFNGIFNMLKKAHLYYRDRLEHFDKIDYTQ